MPFCLNYPRSAKPKIYANDLSEVGLIGPFASRELAEYYLYDTKQIWKGFTLLDASELNGTEEIIDPEVEFITLRIQINRPKSARHPIREILEDGLMRWNDEMGSGPQFYIVEG